MIGGAILAAAVAGQAIPAVSVPNLILAANFEETRWCAFDSVDQASTWADAGESLSVVNAWTSGGVVIDLKVIWGPESADWEVTDSYRLEGWKVVSVERDIGYASSDERLSQAFTRRGDRLVLTRSDRVGPFEPERELYETDVAPYADLRRAPFFGLFARALKAKDLPDGGVCARTPRQRRR